MDKIPSFYRCIKDFFAFRKLPRERRRIVFYSEGKNYWPFLRPFVKALLSTTDECPCYVSSRADDPGLTFASDRMPGFVIGSGFTAINWFNTLEADVLLTTTPDLEVFHLKRSKVHPVHYVHVRHGTDSVFMMLRERAMDHYDSIFCAGPHNVTELRRREELKFLPTKQLWEVGYPYLDEMIETMALRENETENRPSSEKPLRVLVAPSWSPEGTGILETCGAPLIEALLEAGFETTLRPHPRTRIIRPKCIDALVRKFGHHSNFIAEPDTTSFESLVRADILVGDWSAVSMEYAFARLRPVLYIDVPRKVMNPNYRELGLEPFEVTVREKIGAVLDPSKVAEAPGVIRELCSDAAGMNEKIKRVRDENVFNVGRSARYAAEILVRLADEQGKRR